MARKKLAKVQDIPGMKIYEGPDGPRYPLKNIIAAELSDETFEDPYNDPAYFIAELNAQRN